MNINSCRCVILWFLSYLWLLYKESLIIIYLETMMKLLTTPFKEKGSLRLKFIVIYLLLLTFRGKEINTRSVYRIQWLTG